MHLILSSRLRLGHFLITGINEASFPVDLSLVIVSIWYQGLSSRSAIPRSMQWPQDLKAF